jgi:3-oxoacyl-[acyl-carrier protein] reductase
MSYMDLTGKVAIVTGAAQGIGLATAKRLAGAGAWVAVADVNEVGTQQAAKDISEEGGRAMHIACDVSNFSAVERLIKDVLSEYGQIDILVNNAAIHLSPTPIQDVTNNDWDRTIAIDLTGVFYCCRAVIPHMIERRSGRIVNISSIGGKEGRPGTVPYSAAKAGILGLTKALAQEVAKYNIYVNAITPAVTQTPMVRSLPNLQSFVDRIPLGRICQPEEVAAMVHWLSSDEVSFSTGAVFDISGGRATY